VWGVQWRMPSGKLWVQKDGGWGQKCGQFSGTTQAWSVDVARACELGRRGVCPAAAQGMQKHPSCSPVMLRPAACHAITLPYQLCIAGSSPSHLACTVPRHTASQSTVNPTLPHPAPPYPTPTFPTAPAATP